MHLAVQRVAHIEDGLLTELTEKVAPEGRDGPTGAGDDDEQNDDPDEQNLPAYWQGRRTGPRLRPYYIVQYEG